MAVLWVATLMCVATLGHAASVGAKNEDTSYDTIVVGLGAAGTTAATTLARAGKHVLALEAQDRIGGRVRTVPCGEDGVVELGAEWIHGTEGSPTYKLALDNNVTILAQNDLESGVWSDGSTADAELVGELITFVMDSVNALPEAPEPVGEFVTKRLRAYLSENHPELLNNKEFMDEFLIFADLIMDSYDGSDSWNDATTHGRYEQLGGSQLMSWHKIGYKTLFEILLNKYKDGPGLPNLTVKLNTEVTHISWPIDPSKKVVVTTKDGAEFTADNVIVTVSVGVLKERHASLFTPRLPPKKVTAIETITLGVVDKIVLLFSEPWWPEFSSFGFLWRDADRKATPEEDKWYTMVAGVSAPMGCANALTLWTNGATSRHIETLPEEEVKTKSMELLRRFLGHNFTIPDAIGIWRTNWYSNPYTRGSYSFDNLVTPEHMTNRDDLAEPLTDTAGKPRILFAGEASNLHHFSTVHGAVETGQREAARLLNQKVEVAPSTGKVIKSKDRRGMTSTKNTVVGAI